MSLMDRLAGRKPGGVSSTDAVPRQPQDKGPGPSPVPQSPPIGPSGNGASHQAPPSMSQRSSSMYARQNEVTELSPVDKLKVDLHHRLIDRLDLEALELPGYGRATLDQDGLAGPEHEGDVAAGARGHRRAGPDHL